MKMSSSSDFQAGIIPVINDPTEEELSLSVKSKLELIEAKVRQLHEFCLQSGLNARQIELCSSTLHNQTTKDRKWPNRLLFLTFFVAVVAFLLQFDPSYRFICVQGRLLSIKVLPYWDWTGIYEEDCLIANPYVKDNELTEKDCEVCNSLQEIMVMSNASVDDVADDFMLKNIPLIVDDALNNWSAMEAFNTEFLSELYHENEDLSSQHFCQFLTSVEDVSSPMELFQHVKKGNSDTWQASWENCNPSAAKVIRRFYKRPYFVPPMAEAAESNWIFLASGRPKENKGQQNAVTFGGSATWVAQISGEVIVKLEPRAPCDTLCQPISAVLKAGQTLLFTSYLWDFAFYPVGEETGISICSSVIWDML